MATVEYEVILKNGQFKAAAEESRRAVKKVWTAVDDANYSAGDSFADASEQLRYQKDIIKAIEAEIKKIEGALKHTAPGKAWADAVDELNSLKRELAGEKSALVELEKQVGQTEQKHVSLRTELRNARDELVRMEAAGQRGSETYAALQNRAAGLQDALDDASSQMKNLANDQRGLAGIADGLAGISGAFTAAGGAAALFGGANENLQKIMARVQSLMAVTIGLQQVQATLNKDSAFRLVTVAKAQELWGRAVQFLNKEMKISAGLSKALAAGGIGLLAAAIGAAAAALAKLVRRHKEARAAAAETAEQNRKIADSTGAAAAQYDILRSKWMAARGDKDKELRFMEKYSQACRDLGMSLKSRNDYEAAFVANTAGVVKGLVKRAEAAALQSIIEEKSKTLMEKRLRHDQMPDEEDLAEERVRHPVQNTVNGAGMAAYQADQPDINLQNVDKLRKLEKQVKERKALAKEIEEDEKALNLLIKKMLDTEAESSKLLGSLGDAGGSADGGGTGAGGGKAEERLMGYRAQIEKTERELDRLSEEARARLGKTVEIEGLRFTYTQEDVDSEIALLQRAAAEKKTALARQYALAADDEAVAYEEAANRVEETMRGLGEEHARNVQDILSLEGRTFVIGDDCEIVIDEEEIGRMLAKENERFNAAVKDFRLSAGIDAEIKVDVQAASGNDSPLLAMAADAEKLGRNLREVVLEQLEGIVAYAEAHSGDVGAATEAAAAKLGIDAKTLNNLLQSRDAVAGLKKSLDALGHSTALKKLSDQIGQLKKAKKQLEESGSMEDERKVAKLKDALDESLTGFTKNIGGVLSMLAGEFDSVLLSFMSDASDILSTALQGGGDWITIVINVLMAIAKAIFAGVRKAREEAIKAATEAQDMAQLAHTNAQEAIDRNLVVYESDVRALSDAIKKEIAAIFALIMLEREKGKKADETQIAEWESEIIDLLHEAEDAWHDFYENVVGTDFQTQFDAISDMIWEAFRGGEDAVDAFEGHFNAMLVNMIRKQVLLKTIGPMIDEFIQDLGWHMEQGHFTDDDAENYINWFRGRGEEILQLGLEEMEALDLIFGPLVDRETGAGMQGAIKGITSEQAGMLEGQMNAMRIQQGEQTTILTNQLYVLYDIRDNTHYIREIYNYLSLGGISRQTREEAYG